MSDIQKSLGHSHVMAPQFRSAEGAWAVANKLLHKAAMRLRMERLDGSMAVTLRYQLTPEQAEQRKSKRHSRESDAQRGDGSPLPPIPGHPDPYSTSCAKYGNNVPMTKSTNVPSSSA